MHESAPLAASPDGPKITRWWERPGVQGLLLLLLALAAMGKVATNAGWMQDELPIILHREMVHGMTGLWQPFLVPYWPPPFTP
ncbi:MAG: hypothetical protein ACHQXA_01220, partial [Gemmatimonadales bacterium]